MPMRLESCRPKTLAVPTRLAALALGIACLTDMARAQKNYYSIDTANDQLYVISASGAATLVGPLQADIGQVELALHGEVLYARTFGPPSGNRIFQIVTNGAFAGLALAGSELNGGGYQGAEVGGIASDGTSLYISYSSQAPGGNVSNQFGMVDPLLGSITFLSSLPLDADSLGYAFDQFWAIDAVVATYDVYRGPTAPGTYVGSDLYNASTNPIDIDFFSLTELVSTSGDGLHLIRLRRSDGVRSGSIPITGLGAGAYMRGIALLPMPCKARKDP